MTAVASANWEFDVNFVPTTDSEEVLVQWVDTFVRAGWTVIARSDGVTVFTDGTENTVSDWDTNNAWTQLRDPGGGRDFSIERGLNSQSARCFLSQIGDPMTGGVPAAPPTATGAMAQLAGVSGAFAGAFMALIPTSSRYHMGCNTLAAGESGDVYAFYFIQRTTPGAGAVGQTCMCIPVLTVADGLLGDADSEPWVSTIDSQLASVTNVGAWFKASLAGESFVNGGLRFIDPVNQIGLNPYSGAGYDRFAMFAFDSTGGLLQRKGLVDPDILTWRGDTAHATLTTYNLTNAPTAKTVFGEAAFRWPVSVAPLS